MAEKKKKPDGFKRTNIGVLVEAEGGEFWILQALLLLPGKSQCGPLEGWLGAHGNRRWALRSPQKSMQNRGTYGGGGYPRGVSVTEMPHIKPLLSPSGTGWGLLGGMTGHLEPLQTGRGLPRRGSRSTLKG